MLFFSCTVLALFGCTTAKLVIIPMMGVKTSSRFSCHTQNSDALPCNYIFILIPICRTVMDLAGSVKFMKRGRLFARSGMSPHFSHLSTLRHLKGGILRKEGHGGRRESSGPAEGSLLLPSHPGNPRYSKTVCQRPLLTSRGRQRPVVLRGRKTWFQHPLPPVLKNSDISQLSIYLIPTLRPFYRCSWGSKSHSVKKQN